MGEVIESIVWTVIGLIVMAALSAMTIFVITLIIKLIWIEIQYAWSLI